MELLNHYLDVVNNNILPAAAGLGLALELGMRLMPTKKPMSAAYVFFKAAPLEKLYILTIINLLPKPLY